MQKHFFSILIPVYNVEKYLSICLDSVLTQSYKDYEIILVDDGSKDNSAAICDQYQEEYPDSIIVIHKENQGLISARRAALKRAKGEYVCFLDSDDFLLPNALSELYANIKNRNIDVLFYRWIRVDEHGELISKKIQFAFEQARFLTRTEVFESMLTSSLLNPLWCKCCRLDLFDIDRDYAEYYSFQNGEDLIQSLPVLYKAETFYYLDLPLYAYRVNLKSITHNYQKNQFRTLNVLRPLLYEYLVKLKLDTEQNKLSFYQKYLTIIWENLEALYRGITNRKERLKALDEIKQYEHVIIASKYVDYNSWKLRSRIGIMFFYKNSINIFDKYMRFYIMFTSLGRRIRGM